MEPELAVRANWGAWSLISALRHNNGLCNEAAQGGNDGGVITYSNYEKIANQREMLSDWRLGLPASLCNGLK